MPPIIAAVAAIGSAIGGIVGIGSLGALAVAGTSMLSVGLGALAIGTAVLVGQSVLSGKPKVTNSKENLERLRASIDPRTPRKTVVGKTALATDIRDEEFTDSQAYFHRFIVVASHKVHAISEIWFDDKLAWSVGGGVASEFSGYLWVTPILEGNSGNAINISARMGTTRRYTGCAYVHLKYKLTGNSKKTDSPFAQSITTRITIRGDGAAVYDPRLDSTVAGGSGSHRANDQTTWAWNDDACRNPALALLFYLLGWEINGKLAVGKGIPANRIDLESFAVAANICDELVDDGASGTEPRYRCDGVWSEGDSPTTVIDMLKATMNADLDDVDGKLRLTVFHNDLTDIAADFTADDVLGAFKWRPATPLQESFNVVRGVYTDPSDNALYQPVDYPEVTETSPDGIERVFPMDLPMVERASQAQRLASGVLKRQKFGGTFEAEFQATAWAVQKNSVVTLTFPKLGFTNKLFRVAEMSLRVDGVVPLVLREEDASIYDAPSLTAAIAPVDTTPHDPALDPIIDAINSAGSGYTGYLTNEAHTVAAASDGTVSSFTGSGGEFITWLDGTELTSGVTYAVQSATGVSISIDSATGIYTISAMSASQGEAVLRATYGAMIIDRVYSIAKSIAGATGTAGAAGAAGANAKTLTLISDRQTIYYDAAGAASPSTQTTTFTTNKQNTTATVNWSVTDAAGTARTPVTSYLSGATGNSVTMTEAQFASARNGTSGVIITASLTDGTTITDKISVVRVQQGATGANGTNGTNGTDGRNNATVYLYQRAASTPSAPSGTFTYTFATGALSGGTPGSWTQAIPAADGNPLWVIAAVASASTATASVTAASFTSPVIDSGAGLNQATVRLYQRSSSAPAVPASTLTYTFSTGALSGTLGSWSTAVPSGSNPLYTTQATALGTGATDTILTGEWSAPVVMAQDGATGAAGTNGLNNAVVTLYKRGATSPSVPFGTFTYTFATGALTGGTINGWTSDIPATDGNPLWSITALASSNTSTASIAAASFTAPAKVMQDGATGTAGTSALSIVVTKKSVSLPAYANGDVTDFSPATGQLTVYLGNTDVTASATLSATASGCTGTINTATNTPVSSQPKGYYRVTAMSADTATLTLTATYSGQTLTEVFALSKAKGGYEIVGALPTTNLFEGWVVYLSTDDKLYRYTGSAWISAVAAVDITGTITTTQITDDAVTTAKIAANAVTASEIAANAVTATAIATDAVTANKIQAGAVTAAKISVTSLSAITADVGLLRTASSGARSEIEANQIRVYDSAGTMRVRIGVW